MELQKSSGRIAFLFAIYPAQYHIQANVKEIIWKQTWEGVIMLSDALPEIITETLPGPKSAALIARREQAVPDAIHCGYPVAMKRAAGAIIEDLDGNRFLDWIGGVGVLNIGHCHPEVVAAVKEQAEKYFHGMFNVVTHEGYVKLAEKLNSLAPVRGIKKRTYFANSGAEADENAVKVAKAFTKRPNIIVFSGVFHGRTLLTMSMTAKKAYAKGMGPFPDGVYRAEFPYIYRRPAGMPKKAALSYYIGKLKEVFENCSPAGYVAAIVVEPLQGEGGFIPAPIEWIKDALACAAALKTIEIMERDHLAERSVSMGRKVMARYEEWKQKYGVIGDVRGFGGMVGIEFVKDTSTKEPAPELTKAIIEENARHGLLVEGAGIYGNVIRFLAPLVMTNVQLEAGLRIFEQSIRKCIDYEETGHVKVGA